jgi:hypothetical protein
MSSNTKHQPDAPGLSPQRVVTLLKVILELLQRQESKLKELITKPNHEDETGTNSSNSRSAAAN